MKKHFLADSVSLKINRPPKNGIGERIHAGGSCRGICSRYAITMRWGQRKYEIGLRYCSHCRVFLKTESMCCLCCGRKLRCKRRGKKLENVEN